jgi:restriction endonuclease S subunit
LVLIAEDGGHFSNPERGIAYKIKGKAWVNNHAHVLRPREGIIDVDYLAHALRNKDVRRHLSGSTRDKLTKAGACQIEIPLPPLEEQRRIAAILDKVVLLIAENRAGITLFSGTQEVLGSRVPRSRESG